LGRLVVIGREEVVQAFSLITLKKISTELPGELAFKTDFMEEPFPSRMRVRAGVFPEFAIMTVMQKPSVEIWGG
jgi:hypothetical protein